MPNLLTRLRSLGSLKARSIAVEPPAPAPNRAGLAIAAIVRDVAPYLREWLAFHLAAGVSHFVIYDNGSRDGTGSILRSPDFEDVTTVIPWALRGADADTGRKLSLQVTAFAHAITTFGDRFERMAFIDVDEFLVPKDGADVMSVLHALGDLSNISLPWHMFGHSGHKTAPAGLVTENYLQRAPTPYASSSELLRFKCIVDPCRVTSVGVHAFETSDMGARTANAEGRVLSNLSRKRPEFFTSRGIQLNHYYLLSEAELAQKLARGPVNFADAQAYRARVQDKIPEIEANPVEDDCAREYFRAADDRLRRLAGV